MSRELTPSMRRSVLIAALRDPTTWPEGFEWDFNECSQCAMGLAAELFARTNPCTGMMETLCDIPDAVGCEIFMHNGYPPVRPITPAMVADRLEAIHRELEAVAVAST